jgi:hypothetical protein
MVSVDENRLYIAALRDIQCELTVPNSAAFEVACVFGVALSVVVGMLGIWA